MPHYSPIGKRRMRPNLGRDLPAGRVRKPRGLQRLAVAALLALATGVIGCDPAAGPAGARQPAPAGLVLVLGPSEGHPEWPGIRGGAEAFARRAPKFRVQCLAPREETPNERRELLVRALDQHPLAVCLVIADTPASRPLVDLISSAGCVPVAIGGELDDPRIRGRVSADLPDAAGQLGRQLDAIAAGRRSYVLVHESGLDPVATNTYLRFSSAARGAAITLLKSRSTEAERVNAAGAVEELLALFPHAGLVVTLDPQVWLRPRANWHRELRERNTDFRFATLSTAPLLWKHLSSGEAAALVGPRHGELGAAAVQLAFELLLSADHVPGRRRIESEVVTADTLPDFARRYSEAAGGLDVREYLPESESRTSALSVAGARWGRRSGASPCESGRDPTNGRR